jgi:DnaJ-class molecular chaperone
MCAVPGQFRNGVRRRGLARWGGFMRNEKCSHCGKWKIECDHCNGRGYFGNEPFGSPACDHCDGEGIKCEDAWRSSNCG